jgi:hypothetical protein
MHMPRVSVTKDGKPEQRETDRPQVKGGGARVSLIECTCHNELHGCV